MNIIMVDISSLIKSIDQYKLQKIKNIILNDNPKEIYSKIKNYVCKYKNIEYELLEILDDDIDFTEKLVIPVFDKIDVSIVIPVYNQWKFTYNCIRSIIKNTKNVAYEIILADDVSTDETIYAKDIIKNIVISRNEKNLRFLLNCNKAAKLAKGEYILFLNNDTQVQENWLYPMVELMQRDAKIGMTGSMLVYPNGRLQEAGGILWKDGSAWNYGNRDNRHKAEYNYVKEVDYISGASIMIRKSLWTQIGGFDERYVPAYCEDSDLAFEVRKAGYKVVYQPASVVIHFEGVSNGTDLSSGVKQYQIENQRKFYDKWKYVLDKEHYPNGENVFLARDRSDEKKTIVVLDHYVPHFDKDAGSRTTYHYLKLFIEMGMHVIFVGDNYFQHQPYTRYLEQLGIEVLAGDGWNKKRFENWVKENNNYLDIFYLNRPHITTKYIDYLSSFNKKIIYYDMDLHFMRILREYELNKNESALQESDKWKKIEFDIFDKSNIVITAGVYEQDYLRGLLPQKNIHSIPIYLYSNAEIESMPIPSVENRKYILFVGGFVHIPNVDGIKWFMEEIYPIIKDSGYEIIIVGSNAPEEIINYQSEYVRFTGFLSDEELLEIYNHARVSIAPLRYGAGVKGKVIESMYNGLPIVTTSIGAEGIQEIEKAIPISDNSIEYANNLLKLMRDDEYWLQCAKAEQEIIRKYFSVDCAIQIMKKDFDM